MALPKNKSRNITVDQRHYRYAISISWKEKADFDFNITVQSSEENGSKLLLKGLVTKDFWLDFSDLVHQEKVDYSNYPTITPKHIEYFIKEAKKKGWDCTSKGNFILNVTNEELKERTKGRK